MKKADIQDAYAEQTPLLFSKYSKWADGYGHEKVTMVSSQHAHWAYNRETGMYESRHSPVKFGYYGRTTTGYKVRDKDGNISIATSTQLRGTWDECQKTITDANKAAKDAAEQEQIQRANFEDVRMDIGAFGLECQNWDVRSGTVTVSATELLALLRELQKGA